MLSDEFETKVGSGSHTGLPYQERRSTSIMTQRLSFLSCEGRHLSCASLHDPHGSCEMHVRSPEACPLRWQIVVRFFHEKYARNTSMAHGQWPHSCTQCKAHSFGCLRQSAKGRCYIYLTDDPLCRDVPTPRMTAALRQNRSAGRHGHRRRESSARFVTSSSHIFLVRLL